MNGDWPWMHLRRLPFARHLVRAATANFHRTEDRWSLQDLAGELRSKHRFNFCARGGDGCRAHATKRNLRAHALKIISVRERREVNGGQVPLLRSHEPGKLLRAFAKRKNQDASGKWIKCSGMSSTNAPRSSAHDCHRFHT